jgi:CBS domain-containing protein
MEGSSTGRCVRVYVGETDHAGHTPRYQAMLEYLRREGAAGATVVRGIAGFGANSQVHTATVLRLSTDLPVVLTWVDAPARVERLLPGLVALAGSGIVTVDDVRVASYGGRRVEQFRFDLRVRDAMTADAMTVTPSLALRDAVERLVGRGFRALPVVDDGGQLVGMVTNRDLVERGGLEARVELLGAMAPEARAAILERLDPARRVADVMTAAPVSIRASDTLARATHLMAERRLKRLPVVEDGGRLVGIVSRMDILRAAGETFPREPITALDHAGARVVAEIMRTEAPTVEVGADLAAVVDAVTSTRLNRAVVLDAERRVVGVVSDADVLALVDPAIDTGIVGSLMRTAGRSVRGRAAPAALVTRPAITGGPDMPIADAARVMVAQARKVLCVVDADGRFLGIVDRADVLRAVDEAVAPLSSLPASPDEGE